MQDLGLSLLCLFSFSLVPWFTSGSGFAILRMFAIAIVDLYIVSLSLHACMQPLGCQNAQLRFKESTGQLIDVLDRSDHGVCALSFCFFSIALPGFCYSIFACTFTASVGWSA